MDTVITQFLSQVTGRNGRPFSRNTLAAYRRDLAQFRSFVVAQGATSWDIEPATLLEFRQSLRERGLALASQAPQARCRQVVLRLPRSRRHHPQ